MKRSLLALALAGVLSVGLTSCGWNDRNANQGTNGTTGVTDGNGMDNDTAINDNNGVNGTGSDLNTDTDTAPGTQTTPKRTSRTHRSAYDYLNDGRYTASADGRVLTRQGTVGQDLTQGARDLVRDAENVTKRAIDDVGSTVKRAGEKAGTTVRDVMR